MIKQLFLLVICIFVSYFSLITAYELYLRPLFFDVVIVSIDPYFIISLLLGAAFAFSILATLNVLYRVIYNKQISSGIINKTILICGIFFMFINTMNYRLVVNSDVFIECPSKIGYKKNIMRDYTKNINQCKKF
ncbi:hypothetical protein VSP9026_04410 [Vibrio spartinae]|uniref:DUF1240 domain-containing protein n=1 Tax=Vibrio spartinae TaxID=1918945 RepID=A0A1N6MB75_9VIBR|nr:hypothetical protein VSP9026_04410 [Vibrio spartinae]